MRCSQCSLILSHLHAYFWVIKILHAYFWVIKMPCCLAASRSPQLRHNRERTQSRQLALLFIVLLHVNVHMPDCLSHTSPVLIGDPLSQAFHLGSTLLRCLKVYIHVLQWCEGGNASTSASRCGNAKCKPCTGILILREYSAPSRSHALSIVTRSLLETIITVAITLSTIPCSPLGERECAQR